MYQNLLYQLVIKMAQEMDTTPINPEDILNCDGKVFFDNLEKYLKTKIPPVIRNILMINDFDTALVFTTFDESVIGDLENFNRNVLNENMLIGDESMDDYLGRYAQCQDKFMFSSGQIRLLNLIASKCKQIYVRNPTTTIQNGSGISNTTSDRSDDTSPEFFEFVFMPGEDEIRFFNYIGSLMITVFNDAKKLTLSPWSWPSRQYAAEKANQFKKDGTLLSDFSLQYVNPTQHAEFLDSIVKSDLNSLKGRIDDSLALSVRADGSVDRTQDHNVFVLGNLIHKDGKMETVFLGFGIPENEESEDDCAAAYFQCIKTVITKIMPWAEFLKLMSSLVTDGEPLNTGSRNGLWARLASEHQLHTCLPLIFIWCMAHRISLAWKSVCNDNPFVLDIINIALQLCTFFHNFGKRTAKLRNGAKEYNLSPPLQYPSYNSTRWVQYAFHLLNTVLRNWRPSMIYFITQNEPQLEECWRSYDRLRWLTFLADILRLLKTFQKFFQSDTNTILEMANKKQELFERLEKSIYQSTENGWEELFLNELIDDDGDMVFHGHSLITESRTRNISIYAYTFEKREAVIRSLLRHLDERLEIDEEKTESLRPLHPITCSSSYESLKLCHKFIVPDFDESIFITEYHNASHSLQNYEFTSPINTLRTLNEFSTKSFVVLKTALARFAAAKPHSADVERFISNCFNNYVN